VKSINRKVNSLENKILQPFEWGSSKLFIENDVENSLFDQVRIIGESFKFGELSPQQLKLVDEAQKRMWMRGVDIFTETVGSMIHHDNPLAKRCWHMWLGYFIQEASVGLTQMIMEDRISGQKGKTWKQKEKELDKIEWVKVFTRERFEQYVSDALDRSLKPEVRERLEKARKKKNWTVQSKKGVNQ